MRLSWTDWGGEPASDVTMRWENEGWTCEVHMHADRALAILRMSAMWTVQQQAMLHPNLLKQLATARALGGQVNEITHGGKDGWR